MKQQEIDEGLERIRARFVDPWPTSIACAEGWYSLIIDLDTVLADIAPTYTIAQIKEKFGGLRFYVSSGPTQDESPLFWELIRKAEELSYRTCELTGGPGVRMRKIGGHWIRTLDPKVPGILDNWEIIDEAG